MHVVTACALLFTSWLLTLNSLKAAAPMRPTHCGPPEVFRRNSIMMTQMKTRYRPGSRVLYDCMVGYTSSGGRPDVRCVAGKWTPLTLTCEGQCGRRAAQPGNQLRISEGTLSRPGEHPWQLSVQRRRKHSSDPFRHACGGVLIASCWVLTAAQCINSSMDMQVVVGGVDVGRLEESDQVISVERDFIHVDYRRTGSGAPTNDIALLQLEVTDGAICARETNYVKPACLPNKLFPDGKECVVSGWGETKDAIRPRRLSHGQTSLMSKERCGEFYRDLLDNTTICAEDTFGRVAACAGDSGGPLICKEDGVYYLAGLVSWGRATCSGHTPGVYADVHRHVEWISSCVAHSGSPCMSQSDDYESDCSYFL